MVGVDREGAITVTTNVTGAAVKVVSGTAVVATASAIASESAIKTPKVPNGTYEVIVSKDGYEDVKKTVVVNGDITENFEFTTSVLTIASAEVTGAKKITVNFNKAIDTTKATITLKKGTVNTNVDKITYADDKKSAVIETTTKLTKTTDTSVYTVSVAGLTEKALTTTLKADDEKVAKIELVSDKAPVDSTKTTAKAKFKITNQYGEDVTAAYYNDITWTVSTNGTTKPSADKNGILTMTNKDALVIGSKIVVTGVYANSQNGNTAILNGEVTVATEAKADKVVFKGIYQANNKAFTAGFSNADNFKLLFSTVDQYGFEQDATAHAEQYFAITNDNPLLLDVAQNDKNVSVVTVDGKKYYALAINTAQYTNKGGTANLNFVSTTTGSQSTYTIKLDALKEVKTFKISAPEEIVATGEEVEIPFTAADQDGNPVTKYDDLVSKVTLTPEGSKTAEGLRFEVQKDGSAKLIYHTKENNGKAYLATLTTMVKDGGDFSMLNVSVKDKAEAKVIVGLADGVSTTIAKSSPLTLAAKDFKVQDQYGRVKLASDAADWMTGLKIYGKKTVDGTAESSFTEVNGTNNFYAEKLNSIEFVLGKTGTEADHVKDSNKTVQFSVAAQGEFKSYEVGTVDTIYAKEAAGSYSTETGYDKVVNVYGVKEDGSKVLLPASYYDVTFGDKTNLEYNKDTNKVAVKSSNALAATDFQVSATDKTHKNYTEDATITIKDTNADGAIVTKLTTKITVDNTAPYADKYTLKDGAVNDRYTVDTANGSLSAVKTALAKLAIKDVTDQYGVKIYDASTETVTGEANIASVSIEKVTKADGSVFKFDKDTDALSKVVTGDKFTAVFTFGSKTVSADFVVKNTGTTPVVPGKTDEELANEDIAKIIAEVKKKVEVTAEKSVASADDIIDLSNVTVEGVEGVDIAVAEGTDDSNLITVSDKKVTIAQQSSGVIGDKTATFTVEISKTKGTRKTLTVTVNIANGKQAYTTSVKEA